MTLFRFLSMAFFGTVLLSASGNEIFNGNFERDQQPVGWEWSRFNSCDAECTVVQTESGNRFLRIANRSGNSPDCYAQLLQNVPLTPGRSYHLSFRLWGRSAPRANWTLGKQWKQRFPLPAVTSSPQRHTIRFQADKTDFEGALYPLRLIVEDLAPELNLDDIIITEEKNNLLPDWESAPAGILPPGWQFERVGNADASCRVVEAGDARQLELANRTPRAADTFGKLHTQVKLNAGEQYRLSFRVKGGHASGISFITDRKWLNRFPVYGDGDNWTEREFFFSPAPADLDPAGTLDLVLIIEDRNKPVRIADLRLIPVDPVIVTPEQALTGKIFRLPRLSASSAACIDFPAETAVWKLPISPGQVSDGRLPDPADFSAAFALGWSDKGLLLFVRIRDDVNSTQPNSAMYQGDSFQLRIDQPGALTAGPAPGDLELGFSLAPGGKPASWNWNTNTPIPADQLEYAVTPEDGGYFAAILLRPPLFPGIDFHAPKPFSFNLVFNDRDRAGHRRTVFFAPGIHDGKSAAENMLLIPESTTETGHVTVTFDEAENKLSGVFHAANLTNGTADLTMCLKTAAGEGRTVSLKNFTGIASDAAIRYPFRYSVTDLPDGLYAAEFRLNGRNVAGLNFEKADRLADQRRIWREFHARLAALEAAYRRQFSKEPPAEAALAFRVLNTEIPRLLGQFDAADSFAERRFYVARGRMTAPEVEETLNGLEQRLGEYRNGRIPPEYWRYHSGPVILRDGFPFAELTSTRGRREIRPVLFGGYGHFADVIRDLPDFTALGANIIQIEIGPSSFFPREGKTGEFSEPDFSDLENRIMPALKSAATHNVKVCLLLSPHYHPAWLLEKYPEMRTDSDFLKYEITHPKADEMLDAYINAVIPRLKASPYRETIHSLVISNEPVYIGCTPANPVSRRDFRNYLAEKYTTPAGFNAAAQRRYPGFDAMLTAIETDPALKSEFERFRRDTFADWHRRLAERIRRLWPEVPLHAKMMIFSTLFVPQATDPGKFAAFSDYNGNDNYKLYQFDDAPQQSHHVSNELGNELQLSARKLSICNSENHLITDGELRPVPNSHIYTAIFQQYATGASALITWVWTDVDYLKSLNISPMFYGNIRNRPGNIIAHGRAVLDANRVAADLIRFSQFEPEVAILHSASSLLHTPERYKNSLDKLYAMTLPTGHRVRFLSEEQLKKRQFGHIRLLLLPEAEYLDRDALNGLREFAGRGNRILNCGRPPRFDEFGNPLPNPLGLPQFDTGHLAAELDMLSPRPFRLQVEDDRGNREGIFFRAVPDGKGNWLVNLVNYNFEPRPIRLEGNGSWFDLIGERPFHPRFTLAPLKPQLLRFTPAE